MQTLASARQPFRAGRFRAQPAGATRPPRLSVVLPAFNEASRIVSTVLDLTATLEVTFGDGYEMLIVDDGSDDATLEAAIDAADTNARCRVISYASNAGKGHALQRGLASATGHWVAFFDADGDITGNTLMRLLGAMRDTPGLSVIVGHRRWTEPRPWQRSVASTVLSAFARFAFDIPVRETQAGVKVFVRSDVMRVVPECREPGYLFDLELLARMQRYGYRMDSVDIVQSRCRPSRIGMREGVLEILPALRIWRTLRVERHGRPLPVPAPRPRTLPVRVTPEDGTT